MEPRATVWGPSQWAGTVQGPEAGGRGGVWSPLPVSLASEQALSIPPPSGGGPAQGSQAEAVGLAEGPGQVQVGPPRRFLVWRVSRGARSAPLAEVSQFFLWESQFLIRGCLCSIWPEGLVSSCLIMAL